MNFHSHYLWEKGQSTQKSNVSLVLQHVQLRKGQVLFACVCEGEPDGEEGMIQSGYFTERMVEWFHQRYLKLYSQKKSFTQAIEDLQKEKTIVLRELESNGKKKGILGRVHFCMTLVRDEQIGLLQSGSCKIFLNNRKYNIPQIKEWGAFDETGLCYGELQKNVGLILCTENFAEKVQGTGMEHALFLDKRMDDLRIEKRLQELWQEMNGHDEGEAVGVIYLKTS